MKKSYFLILALCVVGLFQGCENSVTQKKLHLVFIGGTPDNYWSVVRLGCDFATRQTPNDDLSTMIHDTPLLRHQQITLSDLYLILFDST